MATAVVAILRQDFMLLGTIYVLNWAASGGMSAPFEQRPGQISVFEYEMGVYRLLDPNKPSHMTQMGTWELLGAVVKVTFGVQFWKGVDPLVLDLDGDGLEMTPQSTISPLFDVDGDGYAERTAWLRPDDGFLVRDLNGNGKIDDVTEMFGGAVSGFSVLAPLDGNQDGKVDAGDNGLADFNGDGTLDASDTFDTLKVWRDLDEDAVTDAGELLSLADLGIASISVASTAHDNLFVNGNQIAATGTFTRTDGTTGALGDVQFNIDNVSTQYTGGPITITAQAAAQPDHKGFGTLVSLREAMSLAPSLVAVVSSTTSQLSSLSLDDLRNAVLPILTGWALASPLGDGDRDPGTSVPKLLSHRDVSILVAPGQFGKEEVVDFAYETTTTIIDDEGHPQTIHFWGLASGESIKDTNGEVIDHPTLAQLLASPQTRGTWTDFDGDLIAFTERYLGENLPVDRIMAEGKHAGSQSIAIFNNILSTIDLIVARLVVQDGPLSSFFSGITYDAQSDNFVAAAGNDRDLIPVYEAIFEEAVQQGYNTAWIAQWKPVLDIIIGDYSRGETYLLNSYGFIAENLVAAYENSGFSEPFVAVATALGIPNGLIVTGTGVLTGSNDPDIFYASTSNNDVLRGGVGPDTYVFGREIGHDIVADEELANEPQTPDTLRLAQFRSEEVSASRDGIDLILTINATGETITVVGQFTGRQPGLFGGNLLPDRGVGEIIFADGTVWDALEIAKAVRHPESTSDTLQGTRAIDFLDGGAGDDVLLGGNEGDHYFFDVGYGHDRIKDELTDILVDTPDFARFGPGIAQNDFILTRNGNSNDLHITFAGNTSDELTITDQFNATYTGLFGVQWWNRIEIFAFADGGYFNWESVIQYLNATSGTDNDDTIYGFAYEDVLDGGKGNDYLSGGNENDTYVFGRGYGSDIIEDRLSMILSGNDDTVLFNADVVPDDLEFHRSGDSNDLQITIDGTDDLLTVQGQFQVNYGLINTRDNRIEFFKFADGTVIGWEDIILQFNASAGTPDDDLIYGFSYPDTLRGGEGDDSLAGGREEDTYIYARGDGNDIITEGPDAQTSAFDTLVLQGIDPADVSLVRNDNDATLVIAESAVGAGDGGSILFKEELDDFFGRGIEQIVFDNGTIWTQNDLRLMLLVQASTSGSDTIIGYNVNDTIRGGAGDDTINGAAGDDTYIYARGDGDDVIVEEAGGNRSTIDTLVLEGINPIDVSIVRDGNHVTLVIAESVIGAGDGGSIFLTDELDDFFSRGIENINFANGIIWTQNDLRLMLLAEASTAGNDTIIGFNVNDTIRGGAGDDTINGAAGDDIYLYARGDGNDVIIEGAGGNFSTFDKLILEGINPSDVSLIRDGNHLTLVISESTAGAGDGGSVLFRDEINDFFSRGVEQIVFADGTIWTQAILRTMLISAAGTPGDDVITGSSSVDIIVGGQGNDTIDGGAGDDIYIYARGDGNDVIVEGAGGNFSTFDTLVLEDINPADVSLVRDGNHVTLVIAESVIGAGDGGSIRLTEELDDFFSRGVEQITFANGTIWTQSDLRLMLLAHASTSGNDTINGFNVNDTIRGGAGDDTINGGPGDDIYIFARGDGSDVIIEDAAGNFSSFDKLVLEDINPADVALVRDGNHLTLVISESVVGAGDGGSILLKEEIEDWFSRGVEQIMFADGTIWSQADLRAKMLALAITPGDDSITGFNGDDAIRGGTGDDRLSGRSGSDTYIYARGDGKDIIDDQGSSGANTLVLHGIVASELTVIRNGDNAILLVGDAGVDGRITSTGQFTPSGRISTVTFDDGTTWSDQTITTNAIPNDGSVVTHYGTVGDDTIIGTSDVDVIDGRGGSDTLRGLGGSDIYRWGVGSGNDTVSEISSDAGTDIVKLINLNSSEVELSRQLNDLLITIVATGEVLKVTDQFFGTSGVEQIVFADDTVWDRGQILGAAWIRGTAGNDTLSGSSDADSFYTKAGNDTVYGGNGGDTYYYGVGSGNDLIAEFSSDVGADTIKLINLNSSDVTFSRLSNELLITIAATGETLTVASQFNGTNGIEQIVFAEGTVWDRSQILDAAWIRGTSGNDSLIGSSDAESFYAKSGNDTLYGGNGGDTYYYGIGFGNDIIAEYSSDTGTDTIKLINLNSSDVKFSRQSNELLITIIATGEILTVSGQFNGTAGIEQIIFADNTVWDRSQIQAAAWIVGSSNGETLSGSVDADIIDGLGGSDNLRGGGGGDTYVYGVGSGNDTISESSNDAGTDVLKLVGLNRTDVLFGRSSNDLLVQISSSGETVRVENHFNGTNGIEQIEFGDGSLWGRTQIADAAWVRGTAAGETLSGTSDAEVFDGLGGNDNLRGGGGGDTYIYGAGSGNDTISESSNDAGTDIVKLTGLSNGDVTFNRDGNDLVIRISASGETLRVENQFNGTNGVEQVVFADNVTWDRATIAQNSWIRGTAANDTLYGGSGDDIFFGGLGDDRFNSSSGSDTYVYALGDGNDYIDEESGSTSEVDILRLTNLNASDLTFSRIGAHLVATVNSNGQTITFDEQFYSQSANYGLERIEFANGASWDRATLNSNAWYRGTSGNDTMSGSSWDDTFKGGLGDDRFNSGQGSDTYVYSLGDGNDYIDDESGSTSEVDTLRLTDLNASDLTFSRVGVHLVATVNSNGQTLTFDEQFYSQSSNYGLERIEFANGTSWDRATLNSNAWYRGTSGDDTMSGSSWNDTISGNGGNDTLTGGGGDDTFVFGAGFGQDTVTDFSVGHDVLQFRNGIFADSAAAFAAATSSGNDTIVTIDATTTVLLQNVALANLHVDDFRVV